MKQDFRTQAYLAQLGNYVPVSGFKDDKAEREVESPPTTESLKREIRIFTDWSEVKRALDNYELLPDDEMHEFSGTVYRFTTIMHALEENGEVSAKYEYEIVK